MVYLRPKLPLLLFCVSLALAVGTTAACKRDKGNDDPSIDTSLETNAGDDLNLPRPNSNISEEGSGEGQTGETEGTMAPSPEESTPSNTRPPRGSENAPSPTQAEQPPTQEVGPSALPGLTEADLGRLKSTFSMEPRVAYLDEPVTLRNGVPDALYNRWNWQYNIEGDGWQPAGSRDIRHTFRSIGPKQVLLRAQADGLRGEYGHTLVVTASRSRLNKMVAELVALVKKADQSGDWSRVESELANFKGLLAANVSFTIPGEGGGQPYSTFKDILYADIPFETRFSGVSDHKYDPSTGQVTFIKLN